MSYVHHINHSRTDWRKYLFRIVGSLTAGVLMWGIVGSISPQEAHAATVAPNVELRACVDIGNPACAPVGTTQGSTSATLECWRDGSWYTGRYATNRWFLVMLAGPDWREGYVHASFVDQQVSVPACSTLARVRAADWALAQIGQTRAPDPWASQGYNWKPGPYAEWSGDCIKFVHMAYTKAAGVSFYLANAIDVWRYYDARGLTRTGLPRYGDAVFYGAPHGFGHTAIYVGGQTVVGTRGMDNANLPISRYGIYDSAEYLGWVRL